ncbi:MAG: hypothetical protein EOP94_00930 [Zymomonas sp.]|nr:MAG: hypothetical protein EOP94_00930 [Zymomonas sp.]
MQSRALKLLRHLGLVGEPRDFSDFDRRGILAMIETGMSDRTIHHIFGYSDSEIACARASNVLTGKPDQLRPVIAWQMPALSS